MRFLLLSSKSGIFIPFIRASSYLHTLFCMSSSLTRTILALCMLLALHLRCVRSLSHQPLLTYARSSGLDLRVTTFGPFFRATCRLLNNQTHILGVSEGVCRLGILHIDSMVVPEGQARKAEECGGQGARVGGVGTLLGTFVLAHGSERGCRLAEILAVDDGGEGHKRLVRHYGRLGLEEVKYVGDGVEDILDRMVWGARGTRMKGDIEVVMGRWVNAFEKARRGEGEGGTGVRGQGGGAPAEGDL